MKSTIRKTLCLMPTSAQEEKVWRRALEPYAWADGEFGLLCTEVAFREFATEATTNEELSPEIRRTVAQMVERLAADDVTDVCLDLGMGANE